MPVSKDRFKAFQAGLNKALGSYDPEREAAEKQAARDELDRQIEENRRKQREQNRPGQ